MDSEEEDFHYSSGDVVGSDEDEEDDFNNFHDSDPINRRKKHYKTLKQEEIKQLQQNDISTVSNVLSVSRGVACTLLCQNNWSLSSVYEKWFSDENKIPERSHREIGNTEIRETYFTSIKDGPGCLTLNCPEPGCKSNPGLDMVDLLSSRKDKDKYYGYLYRSYIESTRNGSGALPLDATSQLNLIPTAHTK
ncbi:hypothetical protein DH2020_021482 [Rehmannia glutinosa]|uniref:E3 ubiquitin-protein ligase ARIH1-like UBA-like domain-containing protein n=1 Tax=Rehmannia glutinosa TaxID=99300 RepID=A0ABR0WAK8_REHGL